jgi:16S rRNA (adenine1518-N6/adenine1519-N6)-dimethyltransferase
VSYEPHLPRKRLGQHFLHDRRVLERIADALRLTGTETVVEIGPGQGALTELLVERVPRGRLIAVELDRDLVPVLRTRYAGREHVEIVEGDVLDIPLASLGGEDFVVAGNVPYYITTPILFHALARPRPRRSVFLVQREVAERVVSAPGSKEYGALSVNVQAVAHGEMLGIIPPGAFRPPPKVESAILALAPRSDPVIAPDEEDRYRRFVQAAFGLRRKQMRRVVRTVLGVGPEAADAVLDAAGIDPEVRPEVLAPDDFARLVRAARATSRDSSA